MNTPLFKAIEYCDPQLIFKYLYHKKWAIFLDSSLYNQHYGRHSYIAVDPFKTLEIKDRQIILDSISITSEHNPFQLLKNLITSMPLNSLSELPPFQGGVAGTFAYDLYQYLEHIPAHILDETLFPDMAVGFYDVVISWDHRLKKAWVVSTGLPQTETKSRLLKAAQALNAMCTFIAQCLRVSAIKMEEIEEWTSSPKSPSSALTTSSSGTTSFISRKITSNFNQTTYEQAVLHVKSRIEAGDIFQANISQCFTAQIPPHLEPFKLYKQLRAANPAPFAAFFNLGNFKILSASPERFLQIKDKMVETRPIKGTRPRGKDKQEDASYLHELESSEKDRAENIMIVDLMRNDLSKVCDDHSVKVLQLCGVESYATVHHLVSVISAKLQESAHPLDLLEAAFPGGSITGAPKIQAMHLIAEIEPSKRGLYCGCLGYIGFDGTMDSSIVIRTFIIKDTTITFQAGGAVVFDSFPETEYQESLDKAKGLYDLLEPQL